MLCDGNADCPDEEDDNDNDNDNEFLFRRMNRKKNSYT